MASKYTTNQDIRDYMEDQGVSQQALAMQMGFAKSTICVMLKKELAQREKEEWLRHIDAVAAANRGTVAQEETVEQNEDSTGPKFQMPL